MLKWLFQGGARGSANTRDLQQQNDAARELLQTLEGIERTLHNIAQACEELPSEDDLAPLTRKAAELAGVLSAASEACEELSD